MELSGTKSGIKEDLRLVQAYAWLQQLDIDLQSGLSSVAGDASFRRYFRLSLSGKKHIVMDAPPAYEDCRPFIQVADLVTILRNSAWARGRLIESSLGPEREVYRMALDLHSNPGLRKAWEARRSHAHQRNEFVSHSDSSFSIVVEEMLEELEKRPPKILTDGPLCGSR